MSADLKREARELEKELSAGKAGGEVPSASHYGIRAYRVDHAQLAGSTLAQLEARYAAARLSVQRVRRGAAVLELHPTLALNHGDELVVSARRAAFLQAEHEIGPEIDDAALLAVPVRTAAVVVTNSHVSGTTIGELALAPNARGVYLESVQRSTELIPRESWTVLQRGDILRIAGAPDDVERAGRHIGFVERDLSKTDLTFLAGGVCAGILLGLLKLNASGIVLGLGTAGSILLIGLIGGWARSRYPVFGAIPEPAQRLLMDIGLIVFIAVVGLHAGPHVERVADGARFLGAIEHSQVADRRGQRGKERGAHKRSVQSHFQYTDLLAPCRHVLHRLMDSVSTRSHDHDHTFGVRIADVLEQAVATAGELGQPLHHDRPNIRLLLFVVISSLSYSVEGCRVATWQR